MSRKHHNCPLCGFLWQCLHILQPHEQRHLLPPGQHPWGGDLRPGSQLCGAMLGARGLALSLGRVHWWSQNLCSWVQLWKCWWRTKRKVDRHLFWQQPWLVHKLQAQVQSEEAQGLLLQSKMPQMERKKKGMCMAQLPHRYSRKDDFWIISTRWYLKKISGTACPLPGSLPHGSWTCEMQEIPIQGTSFLDEDAQSYSGLYGHYFLGAHCSLLTYKGGKLRQFSHCV